eukprot:scaffold1099_cov143-Skeletonema_dohrnii-CCMP3373.AAC.1
MDWSHYTRPRESLISGWRFASSGVTTYDESAESCYLLLCQSKAKYLSYGRELPKNGSHLGRTACGLLTRWKERRRRRRGDSLGTQDAKVLLVIKKRTVNVKECQRTLMSKSTVTYANSKTFCRLISVHLLFCSRCLLQPEAAPCEK